MHMKAAYKSALMTPQDCKGHGPLRITSRSKAKNAAASTAHAAVSRCSVPTGSKEISASRLGLRVLMTYQSCRGA